MVQKKFYLEFFLINQKTFYWALQQYNDGTYEKNKK